ncbi:Hypothetical Protein FCC1311_029442 [Hondaea fermentalgiana]|uniref:Uncharacterized protein n=1 Tax=Hondaea fermentalgiana TaxID=2315210 RepID=A0A2R5GDK8_9STRA|nr:Hypothetical Protein FCC1311_029442 [Hondaea fermentalgiana]|eukprot:GBG26723.1 Hypothetical Protein FCC1311_029442 [Hondaea fermentalgiana]
MGNQALSLGADETRVTTLLALGAGHPVSCLYKEPDTGLLVVGSADGASRLLFPSYKPATSTAQRNHGADLEASVAQAAETEEFRSLVLRPRANEAVRSAYIDVQDGLLFLAIGDACVQVFNLRKLRPQDPDQPEQGLHHEMYAYGRMHTFGACVNAYILHHERHFLLALRRSVSIYELRFPRAQRLGHDGSKMTVHDEQQTSNRHKNRLTEVLDPAQAGTAEDEMLQVEQDDIDVTVSLNCLPCSFDGRHAVFLKTDKYGEFTIEVRDWSDDTRSVVRAIVVKRRPLDVILPESIQVCGDILLAVLNLRTIVAWSVATGQELFRAQSGDGDLIATRLLCRGFVAEGSNGAPLVISMSRAGALTLWSGAQPLQAMRLPSQVARFRLSGPYFLEPEISKEATGFTLRSLVYNDDTGVHMLTL